MENPANEEISLYDDLFHQGDLGSLIHKLQTKNDQLEKHVVSLEEDIQKLCDRITEMKHTQDNLSRNISELYKTAKGEIDRKDRIIAELQSKLDDVVFRRNAPPISKRFREESNLETDIKKPRFDKSSNQNREHDRITHVNVSQDMRHRNSGKNERDSREHTRFDNDRRRRSNSRDRNFRRDYRDNRGRNHSNDRGPRNRTSRGGREYNSRSRTEYHERDRSSRSDEKEQSDVNDQRVDSIDLTTLPKTTQEMDVFEISKEEGEITDVEVETKPLEKKKCEELPREVKKFSVSEYIERQKGMSVKKNMERKIKDNSEKIENKHGETVKNIENLKKEEKIGKNSSVEKKIYKNVDEIKKIDQEELKEKIGSGRNELESKGKTEKKSPEKEEGKEPALKTDKIKILSQVKLNIDKIEPQKEDPKIQAVPKIERPLKESRVPRNLIEDLDIKLEKNPKETDDKKTKSEKIQQKITSLFDTPIKKEKPKILDVKIDEPKGASTNQTPVTEFQIFKTNLPCLEKSNSLTNIQFQTRPDKTSSENPILENFDNTKKLVENESAGYGNTNDICNISLDLLNAEICNYKPEDFPNLTAHTEIRDISDILLSPTAVKKTLGKLETSKNESETKEILNTTDSSTISDAGNARKKRRRCVMKWIE